MGINPDIHQVTRLLNKWHQGDGAALKQLTPYINEELHRLAVQYMQKESAHHTLQATALVNEAFIKLSGIDGVWQDKLHFTAIASKIMRNILVDHAKSKNAAKRKMNKDALAFDDQLHTDNKRLEDIIIIDELLVKLFEFDQRASEMMELTLFGGLTNPEVAETMQVSLATVERELRSARAWIDQHR